MRLLLLVKGGDWFMDGAAGPARRVRLPKLLLGITLSEVMVSAALYTEAVYTIDFSRDVHIVLLYLPPLVLPPSASLP